MHPLPKGTSVDSNDCRELSKRCIEAANLAPDGTQSTLFELAGAWLQLAVELDGNQVFGDQMKGFEIFPRVYS